MRWGFRYTPRFTQVLALGVESPALHSSITVRCAGRGCPYTRRHESVARPRGCVRDRHRCATPAVVNLQPGFGRRHLDVGTLLTVLITQRHAVGKDYRFTVRAGRQPTVRIACLAPGSQRPGRGCRLS